MRRGPIFIASLIVLTFLLFIAASMWLDLGSLARMARKRAPAASSPAPEPAPKPPQFIELDLIAATNDPAAGIRFLGNGREELYLVARNTKGVGIRSEIPRGMLFVTSDHSVQVVATRTVPVAISKDEPTRIAAKTAAIRLGNTLGDQQFFPSATRLESLDRFLPLLDEFPDASNETIQTAILILLHNAPLPVFAKFKLLPSEQSAGPFNSDIFKADLMDIMAALKLLKNFPGAPQPPLIATSSQLKLEALTNPRTHDIALQYYDISPVAEWDFWRSELISGDPATRHYALYGIARYYPDVAFKMLPAWISEPRTPLAYRAAAAFAMAEIENDAALKTLSELQARLASDKEIAGPLARAIDIAQRKATERARLRAPAAGTPQP